jgi:hypothetical protein
VAKDDKATAPRRLTLADQLAAQHELLMAQATKPARTGSQTVEYGERATGADSGSLYLKSLVLVQRDDESDVQFLGRQDEALASVAELLETANAGRPEPEPAEAEAKRLGNVARIHAARARRASAAGGES